MCHTLITSILEPRRIRKCQALLSLPGRNDPTMPEGDFESAKDFVDRMDQGVFDGRFSAEVQKLSHGQLVEVAEILRQRSLRVAVSK